MDRFRKGLLKTTIKRERAVSLGVCLCLMLMGFALVGATFAEPWFSESKYAYFLGDINSWDEEIDTWADGDVHLYPETGVLGDDPVANIFCVTQIPYPDIKNSSYSDVSGTWRGFELRTKYFSGIVNVSTVEFNYSERDFYMSGTWVTRKDMKIYTENITDITPFVAGLDITDIAVITYEANITSITDFAAVEFDNAGITVFYMTDENGTNWGYSWSPSEGYTLEINDTSVGIFDLIIAGDNHSNIIEVVPPKSDTYASGALYVTGNWTDFAVEIEGLGTFSGKVLDYVVKYEPENPTVARTDVNHNRRIDINDVYLVARAYGSTVGSTRYDPNLDFNSDGIINISDLAAVARNFGKTY